MSARARRPGHRHPELGLKTTQYTNRERVIIRADGGGIWERWMYGLRLLNDPAAFAKGSTQLKPGTAEKLIAAAAKAGIKLSDREIQVLKLIAKGDDNGQIAAELHISPKTVKNHISNILMKLQIDNRIQAAVYAVRSGIV